MSTKTKLLLSLILCCLAMSCRKKHIPEPEESFKASFKIYEPFYGSTLAFPTDTIINYRVAFEAGDYSTYSWKVGADPTIRTTRSFILPLPPSESGNTLPVTLIASKNGKSDTVTKSFTVMALKGLPEASQTPYTVDLPYLGRFEGSYEDAPTHKFIVSIVNFTSGMFTGFRIVNLPEGCGSKYVSGQPCKVENLSRDHYSYPFQLTYRSFLVNDGEEIGCCPRVSLFGYLEPANSSKIIIECTFLNNDPSKNVKRKFIGFRV
jgi:hypothetical protein